MLRRQFEALSASVHLLLENTDLTPEFKMAFGADVNDALSSIYDVAQRVHVLSEFSDSIEATNRKLAAIDELPPELQDALKRALDTFSKGAPDRLN